MDLFPSLALTSLLKAYLEYMDIPLVEADEEEEETPAPVVELTGDPFDAMLVSFFCISPAGLPTCHTGHVPSNLRLDHCQSDPGRGLFAGMRLPKLDYRRRKWFESRYARRSRPGKVLSQVGQ